MKISNTKLLLLTFLFPLFNIAQSNFISGVILDEDQAPVEGVQVFLKTLDSTIIRDSFSNIEGIYKMELIENGVFLIEAYGFGFFPITKQIKVPKSNTGYKLDLILYRDPNFQKLEEVMITGTQKIEQKEGDKILYNFEKSVLGKSGTAVDAITQLPGVWLDFNGNLAINGKKGVAVLINGREQNLGDKEVLDYLKSIGAQDISEIELDLSPSAKYDANKSAGLINVWLKKGKQNALFGNTNISYIKRDRSNYIASLTLNYKNDKLDFFASILNDYTSKLQEVDNDYFYNDNQSSTSSQIRQDYTYKTNSLRTGLEYSFNTKNSIGLLIEGMLKDTENPSLSEVFIDTQTRDSISTTNTINDEDLTKQSYSLFWDHKQPERGTEISANIDYTFFDKESVSSIVDEYNEVNNTVQLRNDILFSSPYTVDIKSAKVDVSHPFSKEIKLNAGIKSSLVTSDSKRSFTLDNLEEFEAFKYSEFVNAGYLSLIRNKGKHHITIGLRAEDTKPEYDIDSAVTESETLPSSYFRLYPNLEYLYKMNKNNEISFSYARRINRPNYQSLTPFIYYVSRYISRQGNPFLAYEDINGIDFNYRYKIYNFSISYNNIANKITQIPFQQIENRTVALSDKNINSQNNITFTASIPVKITNWWKTNNTVSFIADNYKSIIQGNRLNISKNSVYLRTLQTARLPGDFSLQLSAFYLSPSIEGVYELGDYFQSSIALEKMFFNKKLSFTLEVNDIFNTYQDDVTINFFDQQSTFFQKRDTRMFKFSLNYKFGGDKTSHAIKRKEGNIQEQKRVK